MDALRGLALTGIALVHLQQYYECTTGAPTTASLIHSAIYAALAGKTFSLLAICFGFSCHMVASRQIDGKLRAGASACVRRLIVLAGIGWVHSLLYRDDMLTMLAIVGLLLLPLQAMGSNRLLLVAVLVCFVQPFMLFGLAHSATAVHTALQDGGGDLVGHVYATGSFADVVRINAWTGEAGKWTYMLASGRALQTIGYASIGVILGRTGFFSDRAAARWPISRLLPLVAAAIAALVAGKLYFQSGWLGTETEAARQKLLAESWIDLLVSFAYLLVFRTLWSGRARTLLQLFCPLGRLSLTFYIGQSLLFVPLFYHFGMGLCDAMSASYAALLGLATGIAQIALAIWWRRHFFLGPMEWLWRAGAQARLDISFRRRAALANVIPSLRETMAGPS